MVDVKRMWWERKEGGRKGGRGLDGESSDEEDDGDGGNDDGGGGRGRKAPLTPSPPYQTPNFNKFNSAHQQLLFGYNVGLLTPSLLNKSQIMGIS